MSKVSRDFVDRISDYRFVAVVAPVLADKLEDLSDDIHDKTLIADIRSVVDRLVAMDEKFLDGLDLGLIMEQEDLKFKLRYWQKKVITSGINAKIK